MSVKGRITLIIHQLLLSLKDEASFEPGFFFIDILNGLTNIKFPEVVFFLSLGFLLIDSESLVPQL